RGVSDGEEDRGFGERVHGHMQKRGKSRHGPAHPEGESDDPHVLDRGVGEEPLDVALPEEKERPENDGQEPKAHQHPRGEWGVESALYEHLAAYDRVDG